MVSDPTEVANLCMQPREPRARHRLARDLATAVIGWAQMPDLALAANNPAAFIHDMDARSPASRERVPTCGSRSGVNEDWQEESLWQKSPKRRRPMGPIVDGRHSLRH